MHACRDHVRIFARLTVTRHHSMHPHGTRPQMLRAHRHRSDRAFHAMESWTNARSSEPTRPPSDRANRRSRRPPWPRASDSGRPRQSSASLGSRRPSGILQRGRGSEVLSEGAPPRAHPIRRGRGRSRSSSAAPLPVPRPRPRGRRAPAPTVLRALERPAPAPASCRTVTSSARPGQPGPDIGAGQPRSAEFLGGPDPRQQGCAVWPRPAMATVARRRSTTRSRRPPAARRQAPGPSRSSASGSRVSGAPSSAAEARAARTEAAAAVRGHPVRFAG